MDDLMKVPRHELYNYSIVLPFERGFSPIEPTLWMQKNFQHSFTISAVYAASIFFGQKLMAKRAAFDLNTPLIVWNAFLAAFSIMGSLRFTPEFFHTLIARGFHYSVCAAGYMQVETTSFWTYLFAMSKVLELFDTMFIVLRKKPLIFLHWYHHITVLIVTWHAYMGHTANGRWVIWMNYTVHACMYSYYALRAWGMRFPKWIPMSITITQLVQMFFGCVITIHAYRTRARGQPCQQSYANMSIVFGIYSTYFLLFAKFFYDAYMRKGNRFQKKAPPRGVGGEKMAEANGHGEANGVKNGAASHHVVSNGHHAEKME